MSTEIRALRSEIIAHTAAVRHATQTLALAVPVVWGIQQLCDHYPAWSMEKVKNEFRNRLGVRMGRGQNYEVHVSKVRELDAQLAAEAQRATA